MTSLVVFIPMTVITPPLTLVTALRKVRVTEDAWNSRNSKTVALAFSEGSTWRDGNIRTTGRDAIRRRLARKWDHELDYRLVMELWAFIDNRMAVRTLHEWRDAACQWRSSYGNELWELDDSGLICCRQASSSDQAIAETDRKLLWPAPGPRPSDHAGILELF